jgi:death-on-curing protein
VIYLTLPELLRVAARAIDEEIVVRDHGLLESALARPQATVFGTDAYTSLEEKAAALVHSIVHNHALVDGNKRLGLAGMIAFLGINGRRLTFSNDQAYAFIMALATELDEIETIAARIRRASEPRRSRR